MTAPHVRRVAPDEAAVLREIRLRALVAAVAAWRRSTGLRAFACGHRRQ